MLGLGTLARVAGELRRDVAAAHQRDPAARGVSSRRDPRRRGRACTRCSPTASPTRCTTPACPIVPRSIAYVSRALTGIEIHPAAQIGDGLFIDHGTRRRDRRDGGDRRRRHALPGRHARRHRVRDRQASPDGRGQRHDRQRRQAARPDRRRSRLEDRRQQRRDHRRRAEQHGRRQSGPRREGRRAPCRGARRRLDPPAGPRRRRDPRARRRGWPSSSAGSPELSGDDQPGKVRPLRPVRGRNPAGG